MESIETDTGLPSNVRESSRLAKAAMSQRELAGRMAEIMEVLVAAHKGGAADMSLTEIRDAYESSTGKRIDLNRVSARVYDLVNAERVERLEKMRPCTRTGRMVHPVRVVPQQARLIA
jgi:hypothetical protein